MLWFVLCGFPPPSSHPQKEGEKPKASGFVITPLWSREQHDLNPFLLPRQSKAELQLTQPPDSSGSLGIAKGLGEKKHPQFDKAPNVSSQAKLGAGFAIGEGGSFLGVSAGKQLIHSEQINVPANTELP